MNRALYAHMNNRRKMKKKIRLSVIPKIPYIVRKKCKFVNIKSKYSFTRGIGRDQTNLKPRPGRMCTVLCAMVTQTF
jgi:hypothetical protein